MRDHTTAFHPHSPKALTNFSSVFSEHLFELRAAEESATAAAAEATARSFWGSVKLPEGHGELFLGTAVRLQPSGGLTGAVLQLILHETKPEPRCVAALLLLHEKDKDDEASEDDVAFCETRLEVLGTLQPLSGAEAAAVLRRIEVVLKRLDDKKLLALWDLRISERREERVAAYLRLAAEGGGSPSSSYAKKGEEETSLGEEAAKRTVQAVGQKAAIAGAASAGLLVVDPTGLLFAVRGVYEVVQYGRGKRTKKEVAVNIVSAGSATIASIGGALAGAAVGTAILPGVGTIVGGFVGGLVAGWSAEVWTKRVANSVIEDVAGYGNSTAEDKKKKKKVPQQQQKK